MADAIYHFAWGTFCDWYIELVKGAFDDETRAVAGWAFDQILVMLHPFMPFITEELWGSMGARGGQMLIHAQWPAPGAVVDGEARADIDNLIDLTSTVRSLRTEFNLSWSERLRVQFAEDDLDFRTRMFSHSSTFQRLTKTDMMQFASGSFSVGQAVPDPLPTASANETLGQSAKAIQFVAAGRAFMLLIPDTIDLDAERARLTKSAEAAEKEASSLSGRLNNPAFVEKAKPEAVEKARADHAEKTAEAERLRAALARLG